MTITEVGGAALEVRIAPAQKRIDLQAYTSILSEVRKALEEVDKIAIPRRMPRVNWAIKDISMDREVRMLLVPKTIPTRRELSSLSVSPDGLVLGVRSLNREAKIPAYFSDSTVHRVGQIGKHVQAGEIDHVMVSSLHTASEPAIVDRATSLNASRAIEPAKKAFSSVSGSLEVLEHRKDRPPRAFVRIPGMSHAVRIEARPDQSDMLREAWGCQVLAQGLLKRNIVGQPVSLELESLEALPERGEPISPWDLLGADPDFTGGLSTEDFMKQVRRG